MRQFPDAGHCNVLTGTFMDQASTSGIAAPVIETTGRQSLPALPARRTT